MNEKMLHRIIGFGVFLVAAVIYFMTVQPSVSFWDCGEFIASSYLMQVPHPPGTPFFLILGRLFSMIPFADNIAFRVNTVSVLSSAFTVLFLYLIAVKLIENYKGKKYDNLLDALGTYIAAAVGALSLAFADTFWFNAVEAEVYALATFFIAIVAWLMMVWNEKADEPDNEKYLILIAYLIGISTGVHLMSVLAIVSITMVIMFRKYITDENHLIQTAYIFIGHAVILLLIAVVMWAGITSSGPPAPEEYKSVDQRFLMIFVGLSALIMGIFWRKLFTRNSIYIPVIIGGIALFTTYPGMVKYIPNFMSEVGGNNIVLDILIILGILGLIGYGIYWTKTNNQETLNLVFKLFLFAFLGFTTYSMIIIRANQDPPINLNSPKTFPELISYLNREQYGDFPTFQRRFSQEPHQQRIYTQYSSDLDFFWSYQMNHMFNRYLMWNYVGRESTIQESGIDPSKYWAIPFIFGLFGMYYHLRKDWKMFSVFMMMFIFLGWLTAFYQNQQEPQPRERDYFYVGAFFVFSIWIAIGTRGLFEVLKESIEESGLKQPVLGSFLVLAFIFIPANMLKENYFTHDRSTNYVPWDYSYNMLQSVAPNAILFTNGDNDTFPLWYLQDVEGVRRDVRIANLSLLNTAWYIEQLKNTEPHGAEKVAMTRSDTEIRKLGPMRWEPRKMSVDVPEQVYKEFGITDTSVINKGNITWTMENSAQFGNVKAVRVQDLMVLDLIIANQWKRPIYFAVTVSDDSRIGLDDYLQMEGLSFRLTPIKNTSSYERVAEDIMYDQLFNLPAPDEYSKDYDPGFKFRGLNDPTIFFDDNHVRLTQNYRNSYMRLALHYLYNTNKKDMVVKTLDKMEEMLPRSIIQMDPRLLFDVGNIYLEAGAVDRFAEISIEVEEYALKRLEQNPRDFSSSYNPYRLLFQIYENLKQYDKALDIALRLQNLIPNDANVNSLVRQYRNLLKSDTVETPVQELKGDFD
ncbi:MAG: DUF2723 domain-containing protein [Melioribacteraceae bacterium]|nr:DUF2723 domain-containing protein [Melioribacteraceae bacterium]MCF8392281.1 DUF2723 domain-containing protein [Melioribacteraceae bacterium]MCF8417613.1 DUF2723 domain-containing protein [Melioribacteraceae bacterium]